MPPLNQSQLNEELTKFFDWLNFPCDNMPRTNSRYCHETVPGITFTGESLTQQSFKEEADINNIVDRYIRTGQFEPGHRTPIFADFSEITSYQDAVECIQDSQENFQNLPSEVRERFGNNPAELFDFMCNEENLSEAAELGLIPQGNQSPLEAEEAVNEPIKQPPEPKEPEA